MHEYIERAQAENVIKTFGGKRYMILLEAIREEHAANAVEIPATGIGDLSDGYHTFNSLYYQRMILFAALVNFFGFPALPAFANHVCFSFLFP